MENKPHYRIQKIPPFFPVLSQITPLHALPTILTLFSHLLSGRSNGYFPQVSQQKPCLQVSPLAPHPTALPIIEFIALRVFSEKYKS
jgi:hypothetical protein